MRDGKGWPRGARFTSDGHTYTLAEVRNGTGWRDDARFTVSA